MTLPLMAKVLLRSIDLITTARPKALLWQARVRTAPNASADGTSLSSDAGAGGARTLSPRQC